MFRVVNTVVQNGSPWTINKEIRDELSAFEMWCYRKMLRVSWKDRVKNEDILKRVDCKRRLMEDIKRRKLQFCDHVMKHSTLQRTILEGMVEGKRARGRQRNTWFDNIKEWTGLTYAACSRKAQQREEWRRFVTAKLRLGDGTR